MNWLQVAAHNRASCCQGPPEHAFWMVIILLYQDVFNNLSASAFFFFFFLVTGELSTLRQMMKVPNEPGLSPDHGLSKDVQLETMHLPHASF